MPEPGKRRSQKSTPKPASAKAAPTKASTKAEGTKASAKTATKLPAALVKRAEQQVAAKKTRLATEGRADIALILRRKARIAEDFYDIGEALVRLERPGVAEALGRASFRELCEEDLAMSLTAAKELIAIVTSVTRKDALRMGQTRALALVALAKATPEADTATSLEKTVHALPSGKKLDLAKASTRELRAAAKEVRAAERGAGQRRGVRPKGRTTTAEERARAATLQEALQAAGVTRARVTAVATKPGQEATVRIDHIPISALGKLRAALGKKA